jgi:porphobilinogen deaminase
MQIEALGVDKSIDIPWVESQLANLDVKTENIFTISGIEGLNDAALAVIDMVNCPIHLPTAYVLAAIIERRNSTMSIAIRHKKVDLYNDLRVESKSKILVPDAACAAQVSDIRPDVEVIVGIKEAQLHDAYITYSSLTDNNDYKVFPLHPRDIVPITSNGFIGIILKKDLVELRKNIQGLHHKLYGQCSNIERGLSKLCLETNMHHISTHCTFDQNGNFHGYVAAVAEGKLIKANLTQSTAFEMDKALFRQLIK